MFNYCHTGCCGSRGICGWGFECVVPLPPVVYFAGLPASTLKTCQHMIATSAYPSPCRLYVCERFCRWEIKFAIQLVATSICGPTG